MKVWLAGIVFVVSIAWIVAQGIAFFEREAECALAKVEAATQWAPNHCPSRRSCCPRNGGGECWCC